MRPIRPGLTATARCPFREAKAGRPLKSGASRAFRKILADLKGKAVHRAALVVHGGTIMSILAAYAAEKEEFYHWQVQNGEGFRMLWDETEKGGIILHEISHLRPDTGLCAGSDLR